MSFSDSSEVRTAQLSTALHVERERLVFVLERPAEEVYVEGTTGGGTFANAAAPREFAHRSAEGIEVAKSDSHRLALCAGRPVRPMKEAPAARAALRSRRRRGEKDRACGPL